MLKDLITKNRSYRRFNQSATISTKELNNWIDLARLSASGQNAQPIKYIISNEKVKNEKIFSTLSWAAALTNWDGPIEGERPSAYIIQILDTQISNQFFCDDGIAAQSILLGAVEAEFGGCIFRSINKAKLKELLSIPDQFEIINVIVLGQPIEEVVLEEMVGNNFNYWRDAEGVHHVPKRPLNELIWDEQLSMKFE
ncbi:MAG: nitroreductase family protein [Prolixibacteraceae bacterium]|jgi:nitroreductase|nr:nitroreductase family protein [Prolixibacteraceae bacterium]